jgi:anti-sigma B factor antagonist
MSLTVNTRTVKGVTIVDLSGKIILGEEGATLRNAISAQVSSGSQNLLLNLAKVTYIDSAGLGELTGAFTSMRNRNGHLKLLHLTKHVHDLMQITKLYTVFDVYDNEEEAIGSFAS